MTKETIRAEIIRGFEDLRFLLTEGVSKGELQPMQTIGMLEQLNQAQWLIEQGMKEKETAQVNGDISLAIYKEDEWNYGSNNLLFTIEQKETAQ